MTTYYFVEDYKHEISVDWGNGKVEKFKMTPSPNQQSMYRLQWIDSIHYVAQGKSKSKLEAIGNNSDFIFNSNALLDYSMNVYNPTKFKLTAQDGTVYIFSDKNGIEEIKDTQGNKITFDKKGVYHSDGKSILFERDTDNRITKIAGPTGKTVTYEYDSKGDLSTVTDISGEITSFVYNDEHYLTEIIDPRGVPVSRNEYNDDGKLVAVVDAKGNRTDLDSDLSNKRESITDRLGNTTVFEYDNRGNIITITDALGNVIRQTYDINNNKTSKTDALGNTTKYEYTEDGKLVSTTNTHGTQIKNTYNTKGELTAVNGFGFQQAGFTYNSYGQTATTKDAIGNIKNYNYEENGTLKSITDNIGVLQQFTYDEDGNVKTTSNGTGDTASFTYDVDGNALSKTITKTNANGVKESMTETYQYDIADNVTKIIYSDGTFTNLEYNKLGDMTASIDSEGRRTSYEYDLFRNLVKINYFDNTFESFAYDAENRNSKAVDRYGKQVLMSYDAIGNLKTKTYQNGSTESLEYDKKYRLVAATNIVGGVTKYEYDATDRNTAIVDPLGNRTEFIYNTLSQLASVKDPKGNLTKFEYDKNGNQTKVILPDGNFITAVYDGRGRLTSQTDQNKYVAKYSYDASDRLVSVVDATGSTWSYIYNEVGELTSVIDPNQNVTAYLYDTQGRMVKTIDALGKEASNSYDNRGNVLASTDFSGQISNYNYDEYDRVVELKTESDTQVFTYNENSLLESVTDAHGITKYLYNEMNQLIKVAQADGMVMEYAYDNAGRQTTLSSAFGSTDYEYDMLNRLITVVDKDGRKTAYTYDSNGNTTTITYSNGMVTTYFYNTSNALIGEKITNKTGSLVKEYAYTVGKAGERLKAVESGGRTVTYTYDSLYRLTKEVVLENATTKTTSYGYDKLSNRTSKNENGTVTASTYNALNQLTKENNIFYAYDLNGNQISKLNGAETTAYVYDERNRLVRATIQEGQNVTVEEYQYDWQGNRIGKSTESEEIHYLVDTNNWIAHVVAETDGSGNLKTYYTRGNDVLIDQVKGDETSYYLYDGQGSVRMLANENNTITDTYVYDAYGVLTSRTGVTENNYLYNGEQFDKTTELYYLRARYMEPGTGMFISMDTFQGNMQDPVSLHKYMYANANPIMYKDPTGFYSLGDLGSAMGIQNILNGMVLVKNVGMAVKGIFQFIAFCNMSVALADIMILCLVGGTAEEWTLALMNGFISISVVFGTCDMKLIGQILSKALAAMSIPGNVNNLTNAIESGDVGKAVKAGVQLSMSLFVLFAPTCFTGDTWVATEDGKKRIDEIEAGDFVWSYHVETGETELKEVLAVYVKESNEILHLQTSTGDIDTTTNHPFYVIGKGWVAAGDLEIGDEVLLMDGSAGFITQMELEVLEEAVPVYNLEVEGFHTYFVGDAGALVHNKCDFIGKDGDVPVHASQQELADSLKKAGATYVGDTYKGDGQIYNMNTSGGPVEIRIMQEVSGQTNSLLDTRTIIVRLGSVGKGTGEYVYGNGFEIKGLSKIIRKIIGHTHGQTQ